MKNISLSSYSEYVGIGESAYIDNDTVQALIMHSDLFTRFLEGPMLDRANKEEAVINLLRESTRNLVFSLAYTYKAMGILDDCPYFLEKKIYCNSTMKYECITVVHSINNACALLRKSEINKELIKNNLNLCIFSLIGMCSLMGISLWDTIKFPYFSYKAGNHVPLGSLVINNGNLVKLPENYYQTTKND